MKVFAAVQELNQHFIDQWGECNTYFPGPGPLYTPLAHRQNEKVLLQFLDQVEHELTNPPRSPEAIQSVKFRLAAAVRCLAERALGFKGVQLDSFPAESFSDALEEFVRGARRFDTQLSAENIYQAGRNAWTAHFLQWLLGLPVQFTPAIFAYSLLYPYTDNTLDDPSASIENRLAFNERLRLRLAGDSLPAPNLQERAIFDLVGMIETQYSRSGHPAVFESLSAIHDAQGQSLSLQRPAVAPAQVDILGLSFYKGGTSVMADGYLAGGTLTQAQRRFTYGLGAFAQLLDDMEDVEEDRRAGRLTLYSLAADRGPLDALANRTFHFGHRILSALENFQVDEPVHDLIRRGTDLLLIDAIGRTDRYYSPTYLGELEACSPFRFSFLNAQRNKFLSRHGPMRKLMERSMHYAWTSPLPNVI